MKSITRAVPYPYNPGEYRISKQITGPRGGKKWETIYSQPCTGGQVILTVSPGLYKETYWSNGWPTSEQFRVV